MRQRNASPHTIASHRDTVRLLLKFAHAQTGRPPSALAIADLDAELGAAFLDALADERAASTATYNLRLMAIRAFFRIPGVRGGRLQRQIQRVLAVAGKIATKREVPFLLRAEIEAILAAPDRNSWLGRRDHGLLLTAVQTGLRLSERVGLDRDAVHLGAGAHVRRDGRLLHHQPRHDPDIRYAPDRAASDARGRSPFVVATFEISRKSSTSTPVNTGGLQLTSRWNRFR